MLILSGGSREGLAGEVRGVGDVMGEEDEEGFFCFLFIDKADDFIGVSFGEFLEGDVGRFDLPASVEGFVSVSALLFVVAWDAKVLVESGVEWVGAFEFHSHVPFADHE